MAKKGAQSGPKPAETQAKRETTPANNREQTPKQKVEKAKETKETNIENRTKKKLEELMGGMDILSNIKGALESWGRLWQTILNMGYEFDNYNKTQDPKKQKEILNRWEAKIKVPEIKDKEKLKTKIEKPVANEKLVDYLYRCLNLPKPDTKEIQPPTKTVKLPHLIMQLKRSLAYVEGRPAITQKFTKEKPTFHKGDMVVLRDKNKTGKAGEFTAGFVEAINTTAVYIRNNESDKPRKYPCAMLFVAFQIPGNKFNGKAPEYPGQKKEKKDKQAKKTEKHS